MINDILDLVKKNNRVIIPNFGAFIISKENGLSILFNNFLSFNDGLLVNHVAERRGIDAGAALNEVNNFVETVRNSLDSNGVFEINGLGTFTKDNAGVIRFHQDINASSLFGSSATAPVEEKGLLDIDANAPVTSEDKKDEPPVSTGAPKSLNKTPLLQIDQEEVKASDSIKIEARRPERKEVKVEEPIKTPPVADTKTNIQKPKAERPSKPAPVAVSSTEDKENRKRPVLLFILLFLILPLIGFGGYYYFFKYQKSEIPISVPVVVAPADTTSQVVSTPIIETSTPEVTPNYENRYQIIAATFSTEKAANEYVSILKGKGFAKACIIPRNSKFLVSIDSEKNLVSAEALQEQIVNKYRIENYIITVK